MWWLDKKKKTKKSTCTIEDGIVLFVKPMQDGDKFTVRCTVASSGDNPVFGVAAPECVGVPGEPPGWVPGVHASVGYIVPRRHLRADLGGGPAIDFKKGNDAAHGFVQHAEALPEYTGAPSELEMHFLEGKVTWWVDHVKVCTLPVPEGYHFAVGSGNGKCKFEIIKPSTAAVSIVESK